MASTNRTRRYRYNWTSSVERSKPNTFGDTYLRVCTPTIPDCAPSGWRQISEEHGRACKLNRGNDWTCSVWTARGELVVSGVVAVDMWLSELEFESQR